MFVLFLHSFQCLPTDNPGAPNFDSDAAALKKAMEGFGSDKAAIVDLLTKKSNAQRQEIRKAFKIRYGKVNIIMKNNKRQKYRSNRIYEYKLENIPLFRLFVNSTVLSKNLGLKLL